MLYEVREGAGVLAVYRWEEIPLERLRVSLTPQLDGGFALEFSVRF